jgi:murein DD-endopeptidase MepM/ murein hydrolase activator NlpD
MFFKRIALAAAALLLVSFAALNVTLADEQDDLNAMQKKMSQTKVKINEADKKEKALADEISSLESQIKASENELAGIQRSIDETQGAIAAVKQDLADKEAEMADQDEDLNARLRAMYMNGELGFLDVILGAASLAEFMATLDMVQKIYASDLELLESMEAQHVAIDAKRAELESLQQTLVSQQTVQMSKQDQIEADRNSVALAKIETSEYKKQLMKQYDEELAEAKRLTEEIARKMSSQEFVGGKLMWPVPGYTRISSEFGNRIHPIFGIKKMHTGLDIPAPTGTPVIAANSGTVIRSGWNNSYGNLVIIDHGGQVATVYAHNSKLAVSEGDTVAQGQTIAYVGSTGNSTGPHCHFEVRVNGEYQNPRSWVTP